MSNVNKQAIVDVCDDQRCWHNMTLTLTSIVVLATINLDTMRDCW